MEIELIKQLLQFCLYKGKGKMSCDARKFAGTMSAVDVLTEQMDDMLKGSTVKAYQLASPDNRKATADSHNMSKFDKMVRSEMYRPLLQAKDYSYTKREETNCQATFDVLLYGDDPSKPTHGYEFALSRQTAPDRDDTLQMHKLPEESQYWRTDHVLRLPENKLENKHNDMMNTRQESFRKACFGDSYDDASVQHSFGVDRTHNLCCKLGEDAKTYADRSRNPIGKAARRIGSDNWSTCMGSNVCTYYAEKFDDGTRPVFATSPDLYKATTHIPSDINCEAYVATQLSADAHGTPGIDTKGDPQKCPLKERKIIDDNIKSQHKDTQRMLSNM